jgi:hypothetical protein
MSLRPLTVLLAGRATFWISENELGPSGFKLGHEGQIRPAPKVPVLAARTS